LEKIYHFELEETGEVFYDWFEDSKAADAFAKEHGLNRIWSLNMHDGQGLNLRSGKVPEAFKDRLREIKKSHHGSVIDIP